MQRGFHHGHRKAKGTPGTIGVRGVGRRCRHRTSTGRVSARDRCRHRMDRISRPLRRFPDTRSSRLSASSRQRTGTWAMRYRSVGPGTTPRHRTCGSIRVSQRHFGAFRGFAWVIRWESPCGSSWKTRSVFQGAVGAFCASTVPSASTGPVRVRQDDSQGGVDRPVLGLLSTGEPLCSPQNRRPVQAERSIYPGKTAISGTYAIWETRI